MAASVLVLPSKSRRSAGWSSQPATTRLRCLDCPATVVVGSTAPWLVAQVVEAWEQTHDCAEHAAELARRSRGVWGVS